MRTFPGKLKRVSGANGGSHYVLNGWQRKWLHEVYPTNTNKDICKAMGISTDAVLKNLIEGMVLEKDEEWLYYERCKKIGRHKGCAAVHDVAQQKASTITVATKLSPRDYKLLCFVAKKNKKNKYEYLQDVIRDALKAASPFKEGQLFEQ